VLRELGTHLRQVEAEVQSWPQAAELLLLHPPRRGGTPRARTNVVKLYRGLDWGVLADRMPGPRMYLAVRGGTTEVPHGHHDLLSFHCVVGDEAMIPNVTPAEYLDTTFTARRYELPEMNPASKNTILVNGLGIAGGSRVRSSVVRVGGLPGIRMDATAAMGLSRDGPAADFCGRLFLLVNGMGFLIVDRIELPHFGRVESRMHTFAQVSRLKRGARLTGDRHRLCVAYACDVPSALFTAQMAPTTPGEGATVLRWCTTERGEKRVTIATFLSPGAAAARVQLVEQDGRLRIEVARGGRRRRVTLTWRLRPARRA
jgi:hypothetical protein